MKNAVRRVLDTETYSNGLVWQLGWVDVQDGIVIDAREYIVGEVYYGDYKTDMYYKDYDQQIADGEVQVLSFAQIRNIFNNTLKGKYLYAYNAIFDWKRLNKTTQRLSNGLATVFTADKKVEWRCIMNAATQTFFKSRNFNKWAIEHKELCKDKTPHLTAQVAYRYIKGMPKFIESHTALDDARIEAEILDKVLRYHRRINWKPQTILKVRKVYKKAMKK